MATTEAETPTVPGASVPHEPGLDPTTVPDKLSGEIRELDSAIESAPVPAEFPEDEAYPTAAQPRRIAEFLIPRLHGHLSEARIAYIYRQSLRSKGRSVMGKAKKVGRKWRSLSGIDFVIEFNYEEWVNATRRQRVRLVDHELAHCGSEQDEDGNRVWTERNHDIEEFVDIFRRWGPARGQKRFTEVARQIDLFQTDDGGI